MSVILKNYQRLAIDKLKRYFNFYLEDGNGLVVFKAPTGSGKTIIASTMIDELIEDYRDKEFCFIWASIGWADLHFQSYSSIDEYLDGRYKCTLLDTDFFGTRQYINNHEIVFVNWEKLVSKDSKTEVWKNTLMKDQEGSSFINVIDETKRRGTRIVLIVDEAHRGTQAVVTRIKEFRDSIILPSLTIEMSATPSNSPDVEVLVEDVIQEGMIKRDIIVNQGITVDFSTLDSELTSEEVILKMGFDKRRELEDEYRIIGSKVKPLVLIQIPNSEQGDVKIEVIIDFFRDKGVNLENKKLLIWTSANKLSNAEKREVKSNDNQTEFLVFKTAVATGWDCPRAQVLVKFREGNSESFEIQTIGRILRTPEAKTYNHEVLDNAYIYTNLSNFVTTQDTYNPNRVKTELSHHRLNNGISIYKPIKLMSFYRSREGDYNSADTDFYVFFENEFIDYFNISHNDIFQNQIYDKLKKNGFLFGDEVLSNVMTQTELSVKKLDERQSIGSENTPLRMSESDIEYAYYNLIKGNLSGLAYVRSKSSISGSIIETFVKYKLVTEKGKKVISTQRMVLNNHAILSNILSKATSKFREYLGRKTSQAITRYEFEIAPNRLYSKDTYMIKPSKLSLYQPLRVKFKEDNGIQKDNYLEASFIDYLDRNENMVEWFWVNGPEQSKSNFGIGYDNDMSTFQPDFIVKFADGKLGIFDTKPIGERVEDTKKKSNALQEYIIHENERRRQISLEPVFGGIVISNTYDSVSKTYSDFLVITDNEYCDYRESNLKWHRIDLILPKLITRNRSSSWEY